MKVERNATDLRDPRSFDFVGRDAEGSSLVAGQVLADIAERDDRIVCGSADLTYVTQMGIFQARHPKRFLQFGISERNMLGAAAGLATMGLIPYVSTFAAFSGIMGYEAIRTDLAYPRMKVRILATHSGISMGFFGTSHHATEDIAALRAVADLTVIAPCDALSAERLLRTTVDLDGPIYFRLGRGREEDVYDELPADYELGKPGIVRRGRDVLVAATGLTVRFAQDAAGALQKAGVSATILDVHTLKPFDGDAVAELAASHAAVVTVEDHTIEGGLGTLVSEALSLRGVGTPVFRHGLRDEFSLVGPPSHLYRYYGLDPSGIATVTQRALDVESRPIRSLWTDDDRLAVMRDLSRHEGDDHDR